MTTGVTLIYFNLQYTISLMASRTCPWPQGTSRTHLHVFGLADILSPWPWPCTHLLSPWHWPCSHVLVNITGFDHIAQIVSC
jgi:hypothetical protein